MTSFDIEVADYLTALSTNHVETFKNFVFQRTKSGECAYEIRNPSGLFSEISVFGKGRFSGQQ